MSLNISDRSFGMIVNSAVNLRLDYRRYRLGMSPWGGTGISHASPMLEEGNVFEQSYRTRCFGTRG
eukprot:5355499-Pyramimonas_sp.AAC.1